MDAGQGKWDIKRVSPFTHQRPPPTRRTSERKGPEWPTTSQYARF